MRAMLGPRRPKSAGARRWRRRPSLAYLLLPALVLLRLPVRTDPELAIPTFAMVFAATSIMGISYTARAAWHPRLSRSARRPWRLLIVFFVLHLVGGIGISVAFGSDPNIARISPPLVFGVASRVVQVLLIIGALVLFAAARLNRRSRVKLVLDVLTVIGGAFIPLWYVLIGPVLAGEHRDVGTALTLYCVTFALCDLGSIVGISTILLRGPAPAIRRPLLLLLIGTAVYLASNLWLIGLQVSGQPYTTTILTDLALLVPGFILVAAAVERCRSAGASDIAELPESAIHTPAPSWLPYTALAIGHGVLLAAAADAPLFPWRGLVVGSLCMTVGVALRQLIALRENFALVRTDPLTGIANRVQLREALDRAVATGRRNGRPPAVLAIDFNAFKQINDTYGHETGDALLRAFASVLRDSVRAVDTPARVGGDEFIVVLNGVADTATAVAVAERILAASSAPVLVDGHLLEMSVSIGIALPDPAMPDSAADDLLRHADRAMYMVKRERGQSWRVYSASAKDDDDAYTAQLRTDVVRAISAGQLEVHYQPIVALVTGELVAVEALVRWRHPTRGLLMPAELMTVAAEAGIVHDVDLWVLNQASTQVRTWQQRLPAGRSLDLSVNLSANQLARTTLAAEILGVLENNRFDPARLVVEIAENAAADGTKAVAQLTSLRERGVRIALDDFGTGYSSLRHLTRIPVDILKLDRSFVSGFDGESGRSAVVEAVIRLGQILHLDTVAERVEDAEEATELTLLGCRMAQGYHFARPLLPSDMDELIDQSSQGWPRLPQPLVLAETSK